MVGNWYICFQSSSLSFMLNKSSSNLSVFFYFVSFYYEILFGRRKKKREAGSILLILLTFYSLQTHELDFEKNFSFSSPSQMTVYRFHPLNVGFNANSSTHTYHLMGHYQQIQVTIKHGLKLSRQFKLCTTTTTLHYFQCLHLINNSNSMAERVDGLFCRYYSHLQCIYKLKIDNRISFKP